MICICHGFYCPAEKIPSGDGVETLAAKPEFGTIVATTGQAAEHIAVACEYGAWKIAVMEQSPGVLRALLSFCKCQGRPRPAGQSSKLIAAGGVEGSYTITCN